VPAVVVVGGGGDGVGGVSVGGVVGVVGGIGSVVVGVVSVLDICGDSLDCVESTAALPTSSSSTSIVGTDACVFGWPGMLSGEGALPVSSALVGDR